MGTHEMTPNEPPGVAAPGVFYSRFYTAFYVAACYLTNYENRATMTVQSVGKMLPQEAKKSHGVAAPWLFRYFLPLRSNHQLK